MGRTYEWKIYKVAGSNWEYWYDKHCRVWVACKRDAEGNQIDGAIDSGSKSGIISAITSYINGSFK